SQEASWNRNRHCTVGLKGRNFCGSAGVLSSMRKHLGLLALPALLLAAGTGDSTFNRKLSKDLRVEHALNRLAFGPRPGDVERVRKMGLDRWIDEQLHPERIAPNPVLMERLKPLETISLSIQQVAEQYPLRVGAGQPKQRSNENGKTLRDL